MTKSISPKTVKTGEIIIRQGSPGDSAYIIDKGRVEISVQSPDGKTQLVGTRGPGTMIGEMALVDDAPRTATIKAIEDCELLEITKEDFSRRLQSADPVVRMTTQVILTRYRDMLTHIAIGGKNRNEAHAEAEELKHTGRADAVETIKITNDFKSALKNKELSLHYQPIVNLADGKITGFEALMRWQHPVKGAISPNIFIPVAEQSGLIVDASRWALREAAHALLRMEGRLGYDHRLFMSVNFSSHDFAAENFIDTIYSIISETDIPLNLIHLEITERLLMDQPANARKTLQTCSDAGLHISIDDFGTGYSSLSYLHYFPIDTLKIDRSFVKDMCKNESSRELIKSIIILGKNMKLDIIAEGVEEKEQAALLKSMGCDMAQGYFFARPMP
jgi:EAL domain-containing protein (putative c-di-GMP-specific phosphodiesterase class I)/CRP-like cAMP-binding protein